MSIVNINTLPTCGIHGCEIHAASHSIYTFGIDPEEVFSRTCNRSLVFAKRNGIEDPNLVIGKDSRDFFNDWLDMALAELQLVQSRFQHVVGDRAVAVLRSIRLTLNNYSRRNMSNSHGAIGFVNVLTSCP